MRPSKNQSIGGNLRLVWRMLTDLASQKENAVSNEWLKSDKALFRMFMHLLPNGSGQSFSADQFSRQDCQTFRPENRESSLTSKESMIKHCNFCHPDW